VPTDEPTLAQTEEPTFEPTATSEQEVQAQSVESFAYQITRAGRSSGSTSTSFALDGDPSTAWMTEPSDQLPDGAFIFFDLGDVVPIGSINWLMTLDGGADQWQIQISYDRQEWTPIANLGGDPIGEWQSIDVGAEARYVRFVFTNPNGAAQIGGLAEIEIRS
jgi:hypothetical protein